MKDVLEILFRESLATSKNHWRALTLGTIASTLFGALALIPLIPLVLNADASRSYLDYGLRGLIAFLLMTLPMLVYETWIAGIAESRRQGEVVDHGSILSRSLGALPGITVSAGISLLLLFVASIAIFGVMFAMDSMGILALVLGFFLILVVGSALGLIGTLMPTFISTLCAIGLTEQRGALGAFTRTVSVIRANAGTLVAVGLLIGTVTSLATTPFALLLVPVFMIVEVYGFDSLLAFAPLFGVGILAVAFFHVAHAIQSILTSHIYSVMRHLNRF